MSATPVLLFQRKGDPSRSQLMAGNYPKRKMPWRGLTLAIETEAGECRTGVSRTGVAWSVRLPFAYGYILNTTGADDEQVDAFIGPYPDAPMVYIVRARKHGDWASYDEDKCFLGFDCAESAQAAFAAAYNDERFEGETDAMPFEEFKAKVLSGPPGMVKSVMLILKP